MFSPPIIPCTFWPNALCYIALPQAKEALERRRLQRIAEDERMRKPWQQPEPPKKAILRAGQKKPITSVSALCVLLLPFGSHARFCMRCIWQHAPCISTDQQEEIS